MRIRPYITTTCHWSLLKTQVQGASSTHTVYRVDTLRVARLRSRWVVRRPSQLAGLGWRRSWGTAIKLPRGNPAGAQ